MICVRSKLRRSDPRHAGGLQRRDVGLGDHPADDHRGVDARVGQRAHESGISSRCDPDRIDRPITWTPSSPALVTICAGSGCPRRRRRADVAGAHGDLLGAVGWPSRPGLPTRSYPPAERLADACDLVAQAFEVGLAGRAWPRPRRSGPGSRRRRLAVPAPTRPSSRRRGRRRSSAHDARRRRARRAAAPRARLDRAASRWTRRLVECRDLLGLDAGSTVTIPSTAPSASGAGSVSV